MAMAATICAQELEPSVIQDSSPSDSGWYFLSSRATVLMDSLWPAEELSREAHIERFARVSQRAVQLYQRAMDLYLEELPRVQSSRRAWHRWWENFDRQQEHFWTTWQGQFGKLFEHNLQTIWSDAYPHRLEGTIPLTAPGAVFLTHEFGDVIIQGTPGAVAHLVAEIKVLAASPIDAQQYAQAIAFQVISENSITKVTTRLPTSRPRSVEGTSIALQMEIPPDYPLQVDNSFGDVSIRGLTKGLKAKTSHGVLKIDDCCGDLFLSNRGGEVSVQMGDGDLHVETSFGPIVVRQVRGDVFASNKFGPVSIVEVSGSVQVENSAAPIEIADIGGEVTVNNHLGHVTVRRVAGDLKVGNTGSPVRIADVQGETHVENSRGEIWAEKLFGNTVILCQKGDVDLVLDEIRQNRYRLDTSFGIVRLNLPPRPSALISAETICGTIDSDFPLEIKRLGSTQLARGKLGQGMADIQLDARNSNIYLISSQR